MAMNFQQAADWFAEKADEVRLAKDRMLLAGAMIVEEEAKNSLGTYHPSVGPFPEWVTLSDKTESIRARMGFPPDNPLLMSGQLRDSIRTIVTDDIVAVGSDLKWAAELENGNDKIPPRPYISRAGYVKQDEVLTAQYEILELILTNMY